MYVHVRMRYAILSIAWAGGCSSACGVGRVDMGVAMSSGVTGMTAVASSGEGGRVNDIAWYAS